jgi:ABC-type nitrate/sulfonate/bicarbonate transport system permease component
METASNPLLKGKSVPYRIFYYTSPYYALVLFFLFWQIIAASGRTMLPAPSEALRRLVTVWSTTIANQPMIVHVGVSTQRIVISLLAAVVFGVPFGVALGWNKTFRAIFKPIFEIIRPVPPIAWVPLVTLWFGTGEVPRMLIIFIGVLMPIVINSFSGVAMVPTLKFEVGRVFGANNRQMLFDIVLPSSLEAIFAGIRTAVGTGWMVLLAAEMLAARSGIGFLIMQGSNTNDLELAIVGMIMIGILGAAFAYGFDYLERWLCPWKRN